MTEGAKAAGYEIEIVTKVRRKQTGRVDYPVDKGVEKQLRRLLQ